MFQKTQNRSLIKMLIWSAFIVLGHQIQVHFIHGKGFAIFSWMTVMLPVTFFLFSLSRSTFLAGGLWLISHAKALSITLGIPTLFASLSWSASARQKSAPDALLHLLLPLTCICLFFSTVEDKKATLYTLFWLIPMVLYFVSFRLKALNLIARALKSTFTAHAVGSVIWAHVIPMGAQQWLTLMPLVAIERMLMVSMTVLAALAFKRLFQILDAPEEKQSYTLKLDIPRI